LAKDKAHADKPRREEPDVPAERSGTGRAIVVVPDLAHGRREGSESPTRSPAARLEEALGLVRAIDLDPVHHEIVNVATARPATLIGLGKIEELAAIVAERKAELAVFDHPLTPVQQRNLEKALNAKVVDRTGIILEIFGERARTREGTLQVELAHLNYQKGRLVRSWTHLERQRGGAGFLGGPGETQIEADRRILQEKIVRLRKELETVRRTRELHRAKRRKVPYPIVAIVGYTNAGKSTLFNRLTGADVTAEDMLFATLDQTIRLLLLPHGTVVILSDTVGFISDLPTQLVAAFRATLEEVISADLIVHVRDISHPDSDAQREDVEEVLKEIGAEESGAPRIEAWNKIDLPGGEEAARLRAEAARREDVVVLSALTGEGTDALLAAISERLRKENKVRTVTVASSDGELIAWLHANGEVLSHDHEGLETRFAVRLSDLDWARFQAWRKARG
jgi:GTP-binding protein HflX